MLHDVCCNYCTSVVTRKSSKLDGNISCFTWSFQLWRKAPHLPFDTISGQRLFHAWEITTKNAKQNVCRAASLPLETTDAGHAGSLFQRSNFPYHNGFRRLDEVAFEVMHILRKVSSFIPWHTYTVNSPHVQKGIEVFFHKIFFCFHAVSNFSTLILKTWHFLCMLG